MHISKQTRPLVSRSEDFMGYGFCCSILHIKFFPELLTISLWLSIKRHMIAAAVLWNTWSKATTYGLEKSIIRHLHAKLQHVSFLMAAGGSSTMSGHQLSPPSSHCNQWVEIHPLTVVLGICDANLEWPPFNWRSIGFDCHLNRDLRTVHHQQ